MHKHEVKLCTCFCASIVFEYEAAVMAGGACRCTDAD